MLCDMEDIMAILPHRPPFLLVDRIIEVIEGKQIVAEKDLSFEDPVFDGHGSLGPNQRRAVRIKVERKKSILAGQQTSTFSGPCECQIFYTGQAR